MRNYIQFFHEALTSWFNDDHKFTMVETLSRIKNGYAADMAREFYDSCVDDLVMNAEDEIDDEEIIDYVIDYLRLHGSKEDCLKALDSHKERIRLYLKHFENDIIEDLTDYLTIDYGD